MDADRFDALARSLPSGGSRRAVLTAAFGGALGLLGLNAPDASGHNALKKCKGKTGDKKKQCVEKAKKHNRQHRASPAPECQNDANCPDKTQACQGGRCQRLCSTGACPGCDNCLVHLETDDDRSRLCAGAVEIPPLVQECRTDADCPQGEPLCVLFDTVSCTREFCGLCVVSTDGCECRNDADCPDRTETCRGGECDAVCFGSFCSPCPLCAVHFESDGDRTPLCADSFSSGNGAASCTTDADCPAGEPTCVRVSAASCTQPPCGECFSVDICTP